MSSAARPVRRAPRARAGTRARAPRTSSRPSVSTARAARPRAAPRRTRTWSSASRSSASVPGPDEEVLVRDGRGLGAPRVDDHDRPPRARIALEPPLDAGRGHEAAVGDQRVRAEHQEERRAVDVGHRQQELVPEHQQRRPACAGAGPPRSRSSGCACRSAAEQELAVEERAVVVDGRVAQVDGDRVAGRARAGPRPGARAATSSASSQPISSQSVPAPAQRAAQAVGILVQILERHALGADVAAAEGRRPRRRGWRGSRPPSTSMASPHIASQSEQVRKCVPVGAIAADGTPAPFGTPIAHDGRP